MKRKQIKYYLWMICSALFILSCTNLEIDETDSIISQSSGEGFTGVSDPGSALVDLYNSIKGNIESNDNLYALSSVTTDEMLIPTRGTDWGDNGIYRTLHTHTWSPSHQFILNVWNDFNQNIFRASEIIDARSNPTAAQAAEAKFLRAFSMFQIMDLFGVVPFREPDEGPEINPNGFKQDRSVGFRNPGSE